MLEYKFVVSYGSILRRAGLYLACFFALFAVSIAYAQVSVLTHHNDNARTGANLDETILNTTNVNANGFGKLFSYPIDADIYTQPLYVPGVSIPDKGTHNVIYVATQNDSVYAFDADTNTGNNAQPLWQVNFTNPALGITPVPAVDVVDPNGGNIRKPGPIGIMGTPVIDLSTNTMYLVARTKENGAYFQRLHALDITSGAEKFGGPKIIQATVSGSGAGNIGGQISFDPKIQNQRPGLVWDRDVVYIAWASHDDLGNYHGWVIGYDAATLQQTGVFNATPDGSMAGIWQSGQPPAVDTNGNLYLMTGNGTFDASIGGRNVSQSFVKLKARTLELLDWFAQHDAEYWNQLDGDLNSGGALLIPGTPFVMGGGKEGRLFLLNTGDLGHYNPNDSQIVQTFQATNGGHIHGSPVYYVSPTLGALAYVWGEADFIKGFSFNGSNFNSNPVTKSNFTAPPGMPGGFLSISANGAQPGTGIMWANMPFDRDAENAVVNGVLRAFDASDLRVELWNSRINSIRDDYGNFAKYVPATVANGKVYVATFSGQLVVYGLSPPPPPPNVSVSGSGTSSATAANLTTEGSGDWIHWGDASLNRKSGGTSLLSSYTLIGGGTVFSYNDDPRSLNWTNGAPTATSTNNKNGVYIDGAGNGFSFTAPADTTTRTLTVYVGGWNSGGTLVAHLSDDSLADFVDVTSAMAGQYDRNYVISYKAASAGQTLTVSWTMSSGFGNVTLNGAALTSSTGGGGPVVTAPTVTTQAATGTGAAGATLNSLINPNNGVTTGWFRYSTANPGTCNDTFGTRFPSTGGSSLGSGTTAVPFSQALTGLSASTPYYFCAIGSNSANTAFGSVLSFTTTAASTGGSLSGSGTSSVTAANLTTEGSGDWIHWGDASLNRKSGGTAQLSSYTLIGGGTVFSYNDDLRPLSWTNGAPTATSTNNKNGVYVDGVGNGFSFAAPADTSTRTLTVHVGGWKSGGRLVAHLSDSSAADYVDVTAAATGQYDRNYVISYTAASAGQTLTVSWTMNSGAGNVTLNGAALTSSTGGGTVTAPTVATVAASSVGATGATLNGSANPNGGATTGWFRYSTANPGACNDTFGTRFPSTGGSSLGSGAAAASYSQALTGLSASTPYYFCAIGSNSAGPAFGSVLSFTTTAASAGGSLSGSGTSVATAANLTTEGSGDWIHWGDASLNRKSGGTAQLSSYTLIGGGTVFSYNDDLRPLSWSNGAPTLTSTNNKNGVYVDGAGNGFSFTAPADTSTRTLTVHVGGWRSGGTLVVHLSDGSAADYVNLTAAASGQYDRNYVISYKAASAGQTLTVSWTMSSGSAIGNVTLNSAALK